MNTFDFLKDLARRLKAKADSTQTWVIFDNTASGAATFNALTILESFRPKQPGRDSPIEP
jgi:uncharacterized protein YecE (DUF72 family)